MESKDKLKEIEIKNSTHYYFYDIVKTEDFDFKKNSYKTLIGVKPFRIRFDKVDRFIRVYDEIRYLVLLGPENDDAIYNTIKYLINQKCVITYVISHNYIKTKTFSSDHMPLEKTLTFHNVIILSKSVLIRIKLIIMII